MIKFSCRRRLFFILLIGLWVTFPLTANSNCGIDFDLLKKSGDSWSIVQGNGPLRSGDNVRIQIEASSTCFFAFFWKDSNQQVFNLTPDAAQSVQGLRTISGQQHALPDVGNWYTLDQKTGKEHLVLVFSESPITSLNKVGKAIALQQVADLTGPSFVEQYSAKWRVIIHSE
jgi:hypothetical protein